MHACMICMHNCTWFAHTHTHTHIYQCICTQVNALENVLVIGLTNRKDLIDPALLRPGRLEVCIHICMQSFTCTYEFMNVYLYMCICMYDGRKDIHIQIYAACVCMCMHMYVSGMFNMTCSLCAWMCECMHIMYMYTHTDIYKYAYRVHIQASKSDTDGKVAVLSDVFAYTYAYICISCTHVNIYTNTRIRSIYKSINRIGTEGRQSSHCIWSVCRKANVWKMECGKW